MSLESILNHILEQAKNEKEKILQAAKQKQNIIIKEARHEAERIYQEGIEKEKKILERQKQGLIVNARLQAKKDLLKTKQELIEGVLIKLKSELKKERPKKQLVSPEKTREVTQDLGFYLNKIRHEHETEIAKILFA